MNQSLSIPGYTYGTSALSRSPISLEDFDLLKKTVLFDDDDTKYLRMSADVLTEQTDAILEAAFTLDITRRAAQLVKCTV